MLFMYNLYKFQYTFYPQTQWSSRDTHNSTRIHRCQCHEWICTASRAWNVIGWDSCAGMVYIYISSSCIWHSILVHINFTNKINKYLCNIGLVYFFPLTLFQHDTSRLFLMVAEAPSVIRRGEQVGIRLALMNNWDQEQEVWWSDALILGSLCNVGFVNERLLL